MEKDELRSTLSELKSRLDHSTLGDAFERYFQRMADEGKIDLLRVYRELFTTDNKDLYFSIERAQEHVDLYLDRHAAGFLTKEMVEVEQRIDATTFDSTISGPLCAYAFTHMEHADVILYLIEHRGINDPDEIDGLISDVGFDAHPSSLRDGLI